MRCLVCSTGPPALPGSLPWADTGGPLSPEFPPRSFSSDPPVLLQGVGHYAGVSASLQRMEAKKHPLISFGFHCSNSMPAGGPGLVHQAFGEAFGMVTMA